MNAHPNIPTHRPWPTRFLADNHAIKRACERASDPGGAWSAMAVHCAARSLGMEPPASGGIEAMFDTRSAHEGAVRLLRDDPGEAGTTFSRAQQSIMWLHPLVVSGVSCFGISKGIALSSEDDGSEADWRPSPGTGVFVDLEGHGFEIHDTPVLGVVFSRPEPDGTIVTPIIDDGGWVPVHAPVFVADGESVVDAARGVVGRPHAVTVRTPNGSVMGERDVGGGSFLRDRRRVMSAGDDLARVFGTAHRAASIRARRGAHKEWQGVPEGLLGDLMSERQSVRLRAAKRARKAGAYVLETVS